MSSTANTQFNHANARIGVIFDCDGTLIDSMHAWRWVEQTLATENGFTMRKLDTDIMTTLSIPECGQYIHDTFHVGRDGHEIEQRINALMMEFYCTRAEAREGALDFVKALYEAGVPMCVASSTPSPLLIEGITHTGFAPYMQAIVSVEDVGASKREPKIYLHCCDVMGTEPESTWVFEDSTYAINTSRNAGFRTYALYDCDLSGTYEELESAADRIARSFVDVSVEELLR